ncbi:MAG: RNA-binding protein [Alphaproteobacteria bacterium]
MSPKAQQEKQRRCIVTRNCGSADGMLRFVVAPDGTLTPDLDETLPGRGIWTTATAEHVDRAISQKLFGRAARTQIMLPETTADDSFSSLVARLLKEKLVARLGLAKRAGILVQGRTNVEKALDRGPIAMLIEAADGSMDGKTNLRNKAKALNLAINGEDAGDVPRLDCLENTDLRLALGAENVVHAALTLGPDGTGAAHARHIQHAAWRWQHFIGPVADLGHSALGDQDGNEGESAI